MSDRYPIGKHWMRVEEDGTILLKYVGPLSLSELQQVLERSTPGPDQAEKVFMIFDVTEATTMEPAARKYGMEWLTKGYVAGAVNFGGNIITRTTAEMLISALRLLHKIEIPLAFVKTEQAARAWIADQRQRRLAAAKR